MKKILVITEQFPNSHVPYSGLFNLQMLVHLKSHCSFKVISPVPWIMWLKYLLKHRFRRTIPFHGQWDGMEIYWPIRFYVPVLSRSLNGLLYLLSIFLSSILLRRKFKYDAIYSVSAYPDGFASALLGKFLNKPVIIRINGSDMNSCTRFYLQRMMIRWALRSCERIIAASADLKRKAVELEVPMEKVDVIYNGVDPAVFFPEPRKDNPSRRKTILYVGNLKREKGVGELVEAFGLLRTGDAELVIIGEGPFRPELESRIQVLGIQAKVKMLGYLLHDQVSKWLRRADILCLPSHSEGLPNVILEAFSSCVPVVATKVGGIPELIVSEEFGMMVPPGDSEALSQSLQLAMAKDWDYQKIKTYAGRFSWEHSAERLWAEISKIGAQGWCLADDR